MAHHHLDNATILRYASGDIDEAFAVVVAAHLAVCHECRHAVRMAEAVGGSLLETGDTADMSIGALDRMMRLLDENPDPVQATRSTADRIASASGAVPAPLRRLIGGSLDDIAWKMVAPGVRKHPINLASSTQSSLYMLNIAAGKAVPEHGHRGAEMTLVLSGSYTDELGKFGPGDIADLDEDLEHRPRVDPDGPCICLVATEAPTRFKGFFSRMLQPVVGI